MPHSPLLPPVDRRELANGCRLLAAERHASETVVVAGMLIGGAVLDPPGQKGLGDLTTAVAPRATTELTYEQIYDRVDRLGASLGMGCGAHTVGFHAKCLSRHLPQVAKMLVRLTRRPSFPVEEFERARGEALTELRQLEDSTRAMAGRELGRLVYREGHPCHDPSCGTVASVEGLGRDDLVACHQRLFRPDAMVVSVVGDVGAGAALDCLEELVGDWQAEGDPLARPDLTAEHPPAAQRTVVTMAEKSQADIALGFKAIPRLHPDYYALDQATQIVGGMGLMGRLGDSVRDRQGLAYYVYADIAESYGDALWSVRAGVNPADVARAVESILNEIRRVRDEAVSEEELADVQNFLVGVLPIRLETNEGIASVLNSIELFGLGDDYLDRYAGIVRSVTREDVQRAAQRHLTAEHYSLAIAGPLES